MARQGDVWSVPVPPLTDEQSHRAGVAAFLARAVVAEILRTRPSLGHYRDDMLSEARVGIVMAAARWNPDVGSSWESYAYGGGMLRCWAWLRAMGRRHLPSIDDDGPWILKDSATERFDRTDHARDTMTPERIAAQRQVCEMLSSLPPRQKLAVARHMDGSTLEEVGAAMGVSRERARQLEKQGLASIKHKLGIGPPPRKIHAQRKRGDTISLVASLMGDGVPRTTEEVASMVDRCANSIRPILVALGAQRVSYRGHAGLWQLPTKKEAA